MNDGHAQGNLGAQNPAYRRTSHFLVLSDALDVRGQRAHGHRPEFGGDVVVGPLNPVLHAALGQGLHHLQDFGFTLQPVCFEAFYDVGGIERLAPGVAEHMAMRRQNEFDALTGSQSDQHVQRMDVVAHVAIGRIDDRGAAIQDKIGRAHV